LSTKLEPFSNDIQPGSVAELAVLHVGDLITSVNGMPVKTPMELAAALNGVPGNVKLVYQFRTETGWWIGKETVVVLGANR
jgi:S1-C subfamily serine protease